MTASFPAVMKVLLLAPAGGIFIFQLVSRDFSPAQRIAADTYQIPARSWGRLLLIKKKGFPFKITLCPLVIWGQVQNAGIIFGRKRHSQRLTRLKTVFLQLPQIQAPAEKFHTFYRFRSCFRQIVYMIPPERSSSIELFPTYS